MAGSTAFTTLPSGAQYRLPLTPRTWVAQSGTTRGDPLRATYLEQDVSGAVAWHRARPLFQAIRTTALAVNTSTWTAVGLDQEIVDTHAGHSDDTQPSRWYAPFTANTSDWYLGLGYVPWVGNATGVRIAGLRVNGAATIVEGAKLAGTAAHQLTVPVIDLVEVPGTSNTNYVELMGWQSSGASLNTVASGKTPSLTMRWVSEGTGTTVALPSPRTWTQVDVLSASSTSGGRIPLNVHIRDVIAFLHYPPIARLTSQGTSQTIASGTGSWTSIQFPAESVDNYGGHDLVTNNTRYTCQRAGLYYLAGLGALVETAANVGYRAARLLVTRAAGGTSVYGGSTAAPAAAVATGTALYATGMVRLAVGDYVELQMQQNQGAALSVRNGAGDCSRLIAVWMSL